MIRQRHKKEPTTRPAAARRCAVTAVLVLCLLGGPARAATPSVRALPDRVRQGDVVLVVVDGTGSRPTGRFLGHDIVFHRDGAGRFVGLAATPRQAQPGSHEIVVVAGDDRRKTSVGVSPGAFPLEELTLPPERVTPSPENLKRARRESARLAAFWPRRSAAAWAGPFVPPVQGRVGTVFGTRRVLNGIPKSPHNGVDLKAPRGTPVGATAAGRIVLAEELFYGGNTVVVDHGDGLYSFYMHLDHLSVKPGDRIKRGGEVGRLGSTGRSTGPHLHFGVKLRGVNVNPMSLVDLPMTERKKDHGP